MLSRWIFPAATRHQRKLIGDRKGKPEQNSDAAFGTILGLSFVSVFIEESKIYIYISH